jgi:hypothetical protein
MLAAIVLAGEGPNTELGWLLWLTFGFFALISIAGWLTSREEGAGTAIPRNQTPPAKDRDTPRAVKPAPRKKSG